MLHFFSQGGYMQFIDSAIQKIKNPKDVLAVGLHRAVDENKRVLTAHMIDGEIVDLTVPQGKFSFPIDALVHLRQEMGRFWFDEFTAIPAMQAIIACVNDNHFSCFQFNTEENPEAVIIDANFKNGEKVTIMNMPIKYFNKKGRAQLMNIEDLIRHYQKQKTQKKTDTL